VVIPKGRDSNKIDYQDRVINRPLSLINPNNNNSSNNNRSRDGRINLNPLPSLSPRKQFLLLINLGIDPPRLLLRLNNRRIMNLGHCTLGPSGLLIAVVGIKADDRFGQFDSSRTGQLNSYDLQRLLAKDATMEAREDCVKMVRSSSFFSRDVGKS
jgi:hypothetical protein